MRKLFILMGTSLLFWASLIQLNRDSFAADRTNPAITQTGPAFIIESMPSQTIDSPFLTGPRAGDPLTIATNYLHQHAPQLGLDEADFTDIVVKDHYVTQHNGVTHFYFRQRYHGIEVFNGDININISRQGEVLNVGNRFVPQLARAINTDVPSLAARDAINRAAAQLHLQLTAPLQIVEQVDGPAREVHFSGDGISAQRIPVKLMYQPQPDGHVRLAWQTEIRPATGQHWWNLRVDAVSGVVLAQDDLVVHESLAPAISARSPIFTTSPASPSLTSQPNTYRVFPLPLESPQDGAGLPASHTLVNNPADPIASPFGWHDVDGVVGAEYHDTRGNNVFAQEDANDNDVGGFRPSEKTAGFLDFDYAFAPAQAPTGGTNQQAAIVNLFYTNNLIHDIMVHYGFDEASGNFQANNYSATGLGGDAVQADAQDGSGIDNANFATPPDGQQPRMQMYNFDLTDPARDGDLDNGIIIHEYGHGISTRLTGGPSNVTCLDNTEQMGEGWSDWFALVLTAKPGDVATQARGMGTYVLGQPTTGDGIRRVPYSTDLGIDPQTYDTLKLSDEVHDLGEVWTTMLWEMYWGLVATHGFDPDLYHGQGGNNLALQLVIDGLKFQPCSPGFVDGRDAILLADQVDNGGANQCTIWQAFAKRGLGFSADQGSTNSAGDGTEAFDMPPVCTNQLYLSKTANPLLVAPGGALTYTLVATNYTTHTLTGVTLHDTVPPSTTYVAASDNGKVTNDTLSWPSVTLSPAQALTRTVQVQVDASIIPTKTIFVDDMESNPSQWVATGLWHLVPAGDACGKRYSPITSWYYGDDASCTYDNGSTTAGQLTTASSITLPADPIMLHFRSWETTEDNIDYDQRSVLISTNGIDFNQVWQSDNNAADWYEAEIDLSAYAGQPIWLRFAFDSVDEQSNNYAGWYVDDVQLVAIKLITNTAQVTTNEGDAYTATVQTRVISPPANDDIAQATLITTTPFHDQLNTTTATGIDDPILSCDQVTANAQTVWYQFTAPSYGQLTFNTMDSNYATVLGVWSGNPGDLTEVACAQSQIEITVEPNTHYFLEVARQAAKGFAINTLPSGDELQLFVDFSPLPIIQLSQTAFAETVLAGAQTTRTLTISNTGSAPLTFVLSTLDSANVPWLAITPLMGTIDPSQTQAIQLGFNASITALEQAGDYTTTLNLHSNIPSHSDITIPITLHVNGPVLTIGSNHDAYVGRAITVPVAFKSNGLDIAAAVFAVEYNAACLSIDPTDNNADGVPDSLVFNTPAGINHTVKVTEEDSSGKLSISMTNSSLPLVTLLDGPLVTATFTVKCQPTNTNTLAPLVFSAAPAVSFGDIKGNAVAGFITGGEITIHPDSLGDANHDNHVNAGDLIALVLEIFDGDGNFWLDAPQGTYAGSPQGCDANKDGKIDAGDIICTVLTIFEGPGACPSALNAATVNQPAATLMLPRGLAAQPGQNITLPIHFNANGHAIAATTFALSFDPKRLRFDPKDHNGDGMPDAVKVNLTPEFAPTVMFDAEKGELQFAFVDLALPLATLPDGPLATVTFQVNTMDDPGPSEAAIFFPADFTASLGDTQGQPIKVTTSDGSVLITTIEAKDLENTIYLPLVTR